MAEQRIRLGHGNVARAAAIQREAERARIHDWLLAQKRALMTPRGAAVVLASVAAVYMLLAWAGISVYGILTSKITLCLVLFVGVKLMMFRALM